MISSDTANLKEKILEENKRVHALEDRLYLFRHPEQTNFFQTRILRNSLNKVCRGLGEGNVNILDLGCGTGYLLLKLLERGYRVTGVDLSDSMIRALDAQIPADHRERARLVVGEADEFADQSDERYDAILISALLHHLYDYETVVKKYCAKLNPGGMLLIFFEPLKQDVRSALRYALHRGIAALDQQIYSLAMKIRNIPVFEEEYELSDYQRRFGGIAPDRLTTTLTSAGMEILEVEKYCARRYGFFAFLTTCLLGTQNTFNLLAKRGAVSGKEY